MDSNQEHITDRLRTLHQGTGFEVPQGYLEGLTDHLMQSCKEEDVMLPEGTEPGWNVPEGYFEELESKVLQHTSPPQGKIIEAWWTPARMRYAGVAASLLMAITLFFSLPERNAQPAPTAAKVNTEEVLQQLSAEDLDADLLCDAGWCDELEKLSGKPAKTEEEDLLLQADEEYLLNEL